MDNTNRFKVGDTIKVINEGSTYPIYETWAKEYSLEYWVYNNTPENNDVGIIKVLAPLISHPDIMLAGVCIDGKQYIIGLDGIELVEDNNTKEFNIGDMVEIVDPDNSYSFYTQWAKERGLSGFEYGKRPIKNMIGQIIARGLHTEDIDVVYGVKVGDSHFVMDGAGLTLLTCGKATPEQEKRVNDSLGLGSITLNISKEVLDKYKIKAYDKQSNHVYLMRKALAEYVGVDIDE